jgi:hypothetical protein
VYLDADEGPTPVSPQPASKKNVVNVKMAKAMLNLLFSIVLSPLNGFNGFIFMADRYFQE